MPRSMLSTLLATVLLAVHAAAQASAPPAPDRAHVIAAARTIIEHARYAALITVGDSGQPQARTVDAFAPEAGERMVVWIATNALSRKVEQIRRNPRVTLYYFDATDPGYVTLVGRAELVSDSAARARHWKDDWKDFYKDRFRGDDYLLIRVTPFRMEVVSTKQNVMNDPRTWTPTAIALP